LSTLLATSLLACVATPSSPSVGPDPTALPSGSPIGSPAAPSPSKAEQVSWFPVSPAGEQPPGREDHTWTVAPDGATAYLFGGRDAAGQAFDDLWAYDLATDHWRQLAAARPPPARFGHNAVWVDGFGLVVFAGQSPTSFYNDLWAYDPDGNRWRQLPADGDAPVARYGSCAAVGPDGRLWISHGFTSEGTRFADTRAYDFSTLAWTDETPAGERPVERCLHGCWWTDDGQLALYAGQTTGVPALADLWKFMPGPRIGTNTWSEVTLQRRWPRERQLYASARWQGGTIVFGGGSLGGGYLDDTWTLADDGTASRIRAGARPAARAGAELIADPARDRLLLFGGRDAGGTMRDVWELRLPAI
jgi:Galactose oxidase, central domain